jgi:hypothetical protein
MKGDRRLLLCEILSVALLFAQEDDAYEDHQKAVSCANKTKGSGFFSYYVNGTSITTACRTDKRRPMNKSSLAKTICIAVLSAICLSILPIYGYGLPVYGQPDDTPARKVPVPSLDVLILVDESETMWNHTDTAGRRVQAVHWTA